MRVGFPYGPASRIALILFAAACTRHPSHTIARIQSESQVRAAERQRFDAMTRQDVAALDTLIEDNVTYVHTDGRLETKSAFIDLIRSKRLVYESIEPSDVEVRVHDGIATATGLSQMRLRSATGPSSFVIRFTEAYVRREGRWVLAAWEATKVSP
jgi:hypothetical protein